MLTLGLLIETFRNMTQKFDLPGKWFDLEIKHFYGQHVTIPKRIKQ